MEFMIVIIALAALVYFFAPKKKAPIYRQKSTQPTIQTTKVEQPPPKEDGPSNALKIATTHKYYPKKLLNNSEKQIYGLIQRIIAESSPGKFIVHAQVPLGEILFTKNKYAYGTINMKRVDFLITDLEFNPLLAIEYNGSGHYDKTSLERDEIKRSAIESANVRYLSIRENVNPISKIREELSKLRY